MGRVAGGEEPERRVLRPEADRQEPELRRVGGHGGDVRDGPGSRVEREHGTPEPLDQSEVERDVLADPGAVAGPARSDGTGRHDPAAVAATDLLEAEGRRRRLGPEQHPPQPAHRCPVGPPAPRTEPLPDHRVDLAGSPDGVPTRSYAKPRSRIARGSRSRRPSTTTGDAITERARARPGRGTPATRSRSPRRPPPRGPRARRRGRRARGGLGPLATRPPGSMGMDQRTVVEQPAGERDGGRRADVIRARL